ncbi:MAG: cell division protein ZapE [Betaproteobacteria bacterium]|nr:cell division protein ZapE [Betaproteobacteria bacterium]MDH3435759.1 cell division protein ZapE [Betaproteobacteria bacterium]
MGDGVAERTGKTGLARAQPASVVELYEQALKKRNFVEDDSQHLAVLRLQWLFEEWSAYKRRRRTALQRLVVRPSLPRGVYLWGEVGRGKTFLMDSFYRCLPLVRRRRVHFHHFMRDVHRELDELKGQLNPLDALADRIARRYRLICFDEIAISDVADAMILGRLLTRTMERGVVYCMTSNYHPDELYKGGLKREDFLPTIALLKEQLDVVHVDGGTDYRKRALQQVRIYHSPLTVESDRALMRAFEQVAEVEEEFHELDVEGRIIPYRHRAAGVVWFDFKVICGWGRSQNDYLDLARRFHTIIVSGVPRMGLERADEARRFTLLVDVLYDQRVKLILSAEAPADKLLVRDARSNDMQLKAMIFQFDRTTSRLAEMQTVEYLSEPRQPQSA